MVWCAARAHQSLVLDLNKIFLEAIDGVLDLISSFFQTIAGVLGPGINLPWICLIDLTETQIFTQKKQELNQILLRVKISRVEALL